MPSGASFGEIAKKLKGQSEANSTDRIGQMSDSSVLTLEDFKNADINQHYGEYCNYSGLCTNLNTASKECSESDPPKSRLLNLLASVTSLSIQGNSLHEPLVPRCRWADGSTSASVDSFTSADLEFFQTIIQEVTDIFLAARIHDLLWIRSETKHIRHARGAIDAYRQFPLTTETSFENRNAWERGIRLSHQIGKGAENRIIDIRNDLLGLLQASGSERNRYVLDLCELLDVCGIERSQVATILDKLEFVIGEAEKENDTNWIRGFCEQAIVWHAKGEAEEEMCRLKVKIAESWVYDAVQHSSEMVSASHYTSAIEVYRGIGKKFREQFGVESRLKELYEKMAESNRFSLNELSEVRSEGINISEWIELSRQCIAGKNLTEAIRSFANLHPIDDVQKLKDQAKDDIERFPLQSLFGVTSLSHDGRVIAKTPGASLHGDDEANAPVIHQKMMFNKTQHVGLIAQGVIFPALSVINEEHRITERDLVYLCQNSAVVPRDRAGLWAKGLYYGFEEKFIEATHILPFQVEHWIRVELKMRNHKTTVLKDGVETEKGLSTLLDDEHISEVLDNNLLFELKAVLTDHLGPNFRNNVAHGLMDPREGLSAHPMYLWWLCLKLVVNNVSWKPQPVSDSKSEECPEACYGATQLTGCRTVENGLRGMR